MTHWATKYIGIPWANGGDSEVYGFDCWHLVRRVQRDEFGIDVPVINIDAFKLRDCITAFSKHQELQNWIRVNEPQEGDCVLMSQSKQPTHIGVWTNISEDEGGVLHSVQGVGVIFTREASIASMSYNVLGFYRYAS